MTKKSVLGVLLTEQLPRSVEAAEMAAVRRTSEVLDAGDKGTGLELRKYPGRAGAREGSSLKPAFKLYLLRLGLPAANLLALKGFIGDWAKRQRLPK